MKLTTKQEKEIWKVYDTWLHGYLNADWKTYHHYLDKDYHFIGSTNNEEFLDREAATQFFKETGDQFAGKTDLRNHVRFIETFGELVILNHFFDAWFLAGAEWNYYGRFRFSNVLHETKEGWRFIYQHYSTTDNKAQEGETIGFDQISAENLQLREAIKRRTKELEEKNRELEIETALEKVRSRSMAMHKSDELADLSLELVKQVQALGVETWFCAFNIYDDDPQGSLEWGSNGQGTFPRYRTPREGIFLRYYEAGQRGDALLVNEIGEAECPAHYEYLCSLPGVGDQLLKMKDSGISFPTYQIDHVAFFKYGYIIFITYKPVPEAHDIFKRFAKVFEQTYTRFLDLQKAEAQAREAHIEVALERIRNQSMLMQHSQEIQGLSKIFHEQLLELQIPSEFSYIWLPDEKRAEHIFWATWTENTKETAFTKSKSIVYPLDKKEPYTAACFKAWESKTPVHIHKIPAKEIAQFFETWKELLKGARKLKPKYFPEGLFYAESYMKYGCFGINIRRQLNEEEQHILYRFTIEFERAYTRFLDLQKAEAQAREAQIQLSLERVRAKSMAMQSSDELHDVLSILFQQFDVLGIKPVTVFISLFSKEERTLTYRASGKSGKRIHGKQVVSIDSLEVWSELFEKWKHDSSDSVEVIYYDKKVLPVLFDLLAEAFSEMPEEERMGPGDFPKGGYTMHGYMPFGYIGYNHTREATEEEKDILSRFATEFGRVYQRFLDIQKAEAQAREAQIQLSLERVRARSMAMHSSEELNDVLSILFQQFDVLGIRPLNVWLSLFNVEENTFTYRATGTGGSRVQGQQVIDMGAMDIWQEQLEQWKSGNAEPVLVTFYPPEILPQLMEVFKETFAAMPEEERMDPKLFPDGGYNVQGYTKFGYIGYNHLQAPTQEEKDILLKFATEFERVYQRFLDIEKAEAQAREAQIEAALERVRARSLAMHNSSEMQSVANAVFEQMWELGIETDAVGMSGVIAARKDYDVWIGGSPFSDPIRIPFNESTQVQRDYNDMLEQRPELFAKTYSGEIKNEYINHLLQHGVFAEDLKKKMVESSAFSTSISTTKNSGIQIVRYTDQPYSDKENEILKRFAKVFEQAYIRFRDLQKAEAQARESQIEAALERIRSQAMAMKESADLLDIVVTMRNEFTNLGHEAHYFWHMRWLSDKYEKAMTSGDGTRIGMIMKLPRHIHGDIPLLADWETSDEQTVIYPMDADAAIDYVDKMVRLGDFQQVDPNAPSADDIRHIGGLTFVMAKTKHGEIGFSLPGVVKQIPEEDLNNLKRFTGVFDLAYRRFEDLKTTEEKNRETEIELALERVRSRSMAMQQSNELKEVIQVVYEQFIKLNIHIEHTGFIMDYRERDDMHIWLADREGVPSEVFIPYFDSAHWNSFKKAKEQGTHFFANQLGFEEKNKFYNDLFNLITGVPDEIKEYYLTCEALAISTVLMDTVGLYIENFKGIPYTDEENKILMRFGKVFQQTYTRFLDLQKAEAQARESQIEAALERIRSRSLAMHHSSELSSVVDTLLHEFTGLNFSLTFCIINLIDGDDLSNTVWAANPETGKNAESYYMKFEDYDFHRAMWKAWKEQDKRFVYILEGEEKKIYDEYLYSETEFRRFPKHVQDANKALERYVAGFTFFKYSGLQTVSVNPITEQELAILERFGKVFEQAYTRFLDLQKSEAQAREANIEAALEKVRSRSLAMRDAAELEQVVLVIVEKLKELGVIMDANGITLCTYFPGSRDVLHWIASPDFKMVGKYLLPYFDHVIFREAWASKESGEPYFSKAYSVAEKNSFFEHAFEHSDYKYFPREFKDWILQNDKHILSFAWQQNSALLIPSNTGVLLDEDAKAILIRFSRVFEQAYVRFMDLQKAEAQAREAQIEAALERIRSRTMGMRQSGEIAEIVANMFTELKNLDLVLNRVLIWTFNDDEKYFTWWSANPEAEGEAESYRVDYNEQPVFINYLQAWQQRKPLHLYTLAGKLKSEWEEHLFTQSELSRLPDAVKKGMGGEGTIHTTSAIDDYGLMMVGSFEPLSESNTQIIQRFGRVFQQSFTRYRDVQKAEEQAREAKIEMALEKIRSRTMAMQHSDELPEAANLLFLEVQALGIPAWSCGYNILSEDKKSSLCIMSSEGELQTPFVLPLTEHYTFEFWHQAIINNEEFAVDELAGNDIKEHYDYMQSLPELQEVFKQFRDAGLSLPTYQINHLARFTHGFLLFITYEQVPEAHDIFKRFTKVFEQTYTRFLDLKKAEAQARESQIEAALEKVRSRTLAMQHSEELAETAAVLFQQLIALGIEPHRLYIAIVKDEEGEVEFWITDEDGTRVSAAYSVNMNDDPTFAQMFAGWKQQQKSLVIDIQGEELKRYLNHLSRLGVPFKGGLEQQRRVQDIAYFDKGFIGMASPDEQPETTLQLLERFAAAFNLTFTRFNDLKIAEAHALQAEKDLIEIKQARKNAEQALAELQATQKQLIQSEKMASLGELTAGIAHEIQNPLNFVNNFSEVSNELLDELKTRSEQLNIEDEEVIELLNDIRQNIEKINHHGRRADAIVKGMLQHSRSSSGQKELTDINALADEYLRLAYHGLRAKDKSFNAKFETCFDKNLEPINIVPQEMGRVILNLINNAFYAVNEKAKQNGAGYAPTITVKTSKIPAAAENGKGAFVEVVVADNGNGMPDTVKDKIFQPFFTTKPTGKGTGLGLSLSYDIVKAHGGELSVQTKENEETVFKIILPVR